MLEMNATLTMHTCGEGGAVRPRARSRPRCNSGAADAKAPQCLHWEARHGRARSTHFWCGGGLSHCPVLKDANLKTEINGADGMDRRQGRDGVFVLLQSVLLNDRDKARSPRFTP